MLKDMSARLNRYKLKNRVVLAYILLSLFTTVALGITIYQVLAVNVMNRIGENSLLSLKQSANAADTLYKEINTLMTQMLVDRDLQNFVYARTDDKVITYHASLSLYKLKSVYPFLQSIELYNSQSGTYFSTLLPNSSEKPAFRQAAGEMYSKLDTQNLLIIPRKIEITMGTVPTTYQVLSFVFRPSSTIQNKSMVILNLDLAYITNDILSYNDSGAGAQTFILDDKNIVIAHSQQDLFMNDFSKEGYLKLFFSGAREGSLTKTIKGEKYLVSYTDSSQYRWYFISLKPYSSIIGGMMRMRNIVLLFSGITFIIALVISILIMRNIYNPFQRLLDRMGGVPDKSSDIELLTKTFSKNLWYQQNRETYCQQLFLNEILSGTTNSALDEEMRSILLRRFEANAYCVMLFKLDEYALIKAKNSSQVVTLLQFNISHIIYEALSTRCTCVCSASEEDGIVALCASADAFALESAFYEILDVTKSLFNVSVSSSIGNSVASLDDIKLSYATASKQMRYRLFEGHSCCLVEVRIQPYLNNDASYPYQVETEILHSIQSNDQNALEGSIQKFTAILKSTACDHVHYYSAQLAYALLRFADDESLSKAVSYDLMQRIADSDVVDALSRHLWQVSFDLMKSKQDVRQVRSNQKHIKTINEIKHFAEGNYNDANLSLESLSEVICLSPEYIRKLFKQVEGSSFSRFLTDLRLRTARDLLAATDIPAMQIGEQVGLYNTTYFFTLFKKAYGLTPTAYREQERKKQAVGD